jgi:hypothetical protein
MPLNRPGLIVPGHYRKMRLDQPFTWDLCKEGFLYSKDLVRYQERYVEQFFFRYITFGDNDL